MQNEWDWWITPYIIHQFFRPYNQRFLYKGEKKGKRMVEMTTTIFIPQLFKIRQVETDLKVRLTALIPDNCWDSMITTEIISGLRRTGLVHISLRLTWKIKCKNYSFHITFKKIGIFIICNKYRPDTQKRILHAFQTYVLFYMLFKHVCYIWKYFSKPYDNYR